MVAFDGSPEEIKALTAHLERAQLNRGNPYLINSWHTGINPGTYFIGDPYEDLENGNNCFRLSDIPICMQQEKTRVMWHFI